MLASNTPTMSSRCGSGNGLDKVSDAKDKDGPGQTEQEVNHRGEVSWMLDILQTFAPGTLRHSIQKTSQSSGLY